jgi:hypothetical protein
MKGLIATDLFAVEDGQRRPQGDKVCTQTLHGGSSEVAKCSDDELKKKLKNRRECRAPILPKDPLTLNALLPSKQ